MCVSKRAGMFLLVQEYLYTPPGSGRKSPAKEQLPLLLFRVLEEEEHLDGNIPPDYYTV